MGDFHSNFFTRNSKTTNPNGRVLHALADGGAEVTVKGAQTPTYHLNNVDNRADVLDIIVSRNTNVPMEIAGRFI